MLDPGAFVHPEAVAIGDAIIGPAVHVGAATVLRGDFGRRTMVGTNAVTMDGAIIAATGSVKAGAPAGSAAKVVRALAKEMQGTGV